MEKQIAKYNEKGYCYFAVDELGSGRLIGMIGISDKDFEAKFTPCIDIGWRLAKEF
jgi:RimJ/RimL family protein N-acetyltransferase